MLHEKIKTEVKDAMREKNEIKLLAIRGLLSAITNELVAQKIKPSELLPDEEVLKVLKRQVKQRKDASEQFRAGGREDLVENEEKELSFLKEYLPEELSDGTLRDIAEKKSKELGVSDKSKLGALMGAVMKEVAGRADGARVKAAVEKLFG